MNSMWEWILILKPICTLKTFYKFSDLLLHDIMTISSPLNKIYSFPLRQNMSHKYT